MRRLKNVGLAVLCGLLGGCEKYALDRQMEELCKRDGGTKVFEYVRLPKDRFDVNGQIRQVPPEAAKVDPQARFGSEFRVVSTKTYLRDGDPLKGEGVLWRSEHRLVRNADSRLLATTVVYRRRGGDPLPLLLLGGHPSSKGCPEHDAGLESAFLKGD